MFVLFRLVRIVNKSNQIGSYSIPIYSLNLQASTWPSSLLHHPQLGRLPTQPPFICNLKMIPRGNGIIWDRLGRGKTASLGISIVPTFNLPTTINISSNINSNISGNSTLSLSLSSSSSLSSSLIASLIASKPSLVSPSSSEAAINSLLLARKLLENFVNYALSFSQSFPTSPDTKESFIPAKIITDWYNGTVRRAQLDPVGFFQNLMKTTD